MWGPLAKILAIDDEPDILSLIERTLQKASHLVTTALSPDSIELKTLNHYDLILLDGRLFVLSESAGCSGLPDPVSDRENDGVRRDVWIWPGRG